MKTLYKISILLLLAGFFVWPADISAATGDTLVVQWDIEGDFNPTIGALRNAIENDTDRPEGRVYKLLRGGYYWLPQAIENSGFHLRIVGEPAGDSAEENPPVLQISPREDGTEPDGSILLAGGDVTLKNLWITGADINGTQTYYQPVAFNASNTKIHIENVIFDRSNFAMIAVSGSNNEIVIRDCVFRNLIGEPNDQQWQGRAISIWADQKSVLVENNTFFNIGMTALQIESGAAEYVRFVHNTLVFVGRGMNTGNWWREAYVANNLIINGFWHSEGLRDRSEPNRNPRSITSGIFSIGTLPSVYGPNSGRRILFSNNSAWLDPAFIAHYADSLYRQPFAGPITREDYFDNEALENIVAKDTVWLANRPNFPVYPSELIPTMIQNITQLRANETPAVSYFYELPADEFGICHTCVSWPLPENFSYTDANLMTASTNGLPLGDLNWFPAQKADWVANYESYISDIEGSAGPVVVITVEDNVEAESGSISGDASVDTFDGFAYFQMDGGGYMNWDFNLETAGQYDLNVWTHMRGNGARGQRILVNGANIRNPQNWGEYIWDASGDNGNEWVGMPINEWTWTLIKQENLHENYATALELPAGPNTIRIESSWGYQNFAGIDVIPAGTSDAAVELRAPDATYSIIEPRCADSPGGDVSEFCPSGFKKVILGSEGNEGSLSLSMNAPSDGSYFLLIFYQTPEGMASASISSGGNSIDDDLLFNGVDGDISGRSVETSLFNLTAGNHTFTIATSDRIDVDFVQLVKRSSTTSIDRGIDGPEGFALSQNYPNPFNPSTNINFTLPQASNVKLTVYNILGQQVAVLADGLYSSGMHTVRFNGQMLASGTYIYRIESGDFIQVKKMILIK